MLLLVVVLTVLSTLSSDAHRISLPSNGQMAASEVCSNEENTFDGIYLVDMQCKIHTSKVCGVVPFELMFCLPGRVADFRHKDLPDNFFIRYNFGSGRVSVCQMSIGFEGPPSKYSIIQNFKCKPYYPSHKDPIRVFANCKGMNKSQLLLTERDVAISCPHNSLYSAFAAYGYGFGMVLCSFVTMCLVSWNRSAFPHKRDQSILNAGRKDRGSKSGWGRSLMTSVTRGRTRTRTSDQTISAYQIEQALSQIETAARSTIQTSMT
ncbi:unnamed protein product [Auanema sp. JU1783]|nr:unnamed protein product [Auanema sp. JU1783]